MISPKYHHFSISIHTFYVSVSSTIIYVATWYWILFTFFYKIVCLNDRPQMEILVPLLRGLHWSCSSFSMRCHDLWRSINCCFIDDIWAAWCSCNEHIVSLRVLVYLSLRCPSITASNVRNKIGLSAKSSGF